MIVLNGVLFAENNKEFISSLFNSKNTASGYYKILKRKIKLFDHNNTLIGIINRYGVLCKARLLDNGKYYYSYRNPEIIGQEYKYMEMINDIDKLTIRKEYTSKDTEYYYK